MTFHHFKQLKFKGILSTTYMLSNFKIVLTVEMNQSFCILKMKNKILSGLLKIMAHEPPVHLKAIYLFLGIISLSSFMLINPLLLLMHSVFFSQHNSVNHSLILKPCL